jgi:Fe-S cluster biosynthesis and repair protein YggX
MTRTVFCRKYQKELDGLDAPPLPGKRGQEIFDSVSRKAWLAWQDLQTMIINERHLNMLEPEARKFLSDQMIRFFDNETVEGAEGYVPPEDPPT